MSNIEYLILTLLFIIVIFVIVYLYISNKDLKTKVNVLKDTVEIVKLKNKKYKFYIELKEFIFLELNDLSIETKCFLLDNIVKTFNNNMKEFYIESPYKLLIQNIFRLVIRFNLINNTLCDINIEYKTNNNILTFKIK